MIQAVQQNLFLCQTFHLTFRLYNYTVSGNLVAIIQTHCEMDTTLTSAVPCVFAHLLLKPAAVECLLYSPVHCGLQPPPHWLLHPKEAAKAHYLCYIKQYLTSCKGHCDINKQHVACLCMCFGPAPQKCVHATLQR